MTTDAEWRQLIDAAGDDEKTLLEIERLMDAEAIQTSPATFARRISEGTAEPWQPYRHLKFLDDKVLDLIEGRSEKKRLMVLMPPRHGKSLYVSTYLPVWFLCRFPERRVILTSYQDEFARTWGRRCRNMIEDNKHLLPIRVKRTSSAADRWDLEGHLGGMVTAGAGGPITGKGAHLFVIDDPVKNAEEAYSQAHRDANWEWWTTTAFTRFEPGAVGILLMTRWHEDDLGGRLIAEDGDNWEVVNLPALAEEDDPLGREPGEALCPERYDENALGAMRATMGADAWSALYQQRPQPEGGGRFRKATFKYWSPEVNDGKRLYRLKPRAKEENAQSILVPEEDCWRFITVDFAITEKTSGDYTVAAVWDVAPHPEPSKLILVDRERARVVGPDHLPMLERMYEQYRPRFIGVERASFGIGVIQAAIRRGLPIRELIPDKDKWARSEQAAVMCENGRVYFPDKMPWLHEWEQELLAFPAAAHDDQVDAFAYAALEVFRGLNLARKQKPGEPQSMSEKIWASLERRVKGPKHHPVLGRM